MRDGIYDETDYWSMICDLTKLGHDIEKIGSMGMCRKCDGLFDLALKTQYVGRGDMWDTDYWTPELRKCKDVIIKEIIE